MLTYNPLRFKALPEAGFIPECDTLFACLEVVESNTGWELLKESGDWTIRVDTKWLGDSLKAGITTQDGVHHEEK